MKNATLRIEALDPGCAAFLMEELVGRFHAELHETDFGWEVHVRDDERSTRAIIDALDIVADWLRDNGIARTRVYYCGEKFMLEASAHRLWDTPRVLVGKR